ATRGPGAGRRGTDERGDVRRRRGRPGRRQGGRDAARGGLRRSGDPARGRAGPAVRAAAAVQGVHEGRGGARQGLRARGGLVRRPRRRPAHVKPGDRAGPLGARQRYDKLLIATGSQPRRLPAPGADLDGVHYLRTLPDAERIRAALTSGGRVVIVGGGWIGLETASAARHHGAEVVLVEPEQTPLARVLGPELGGF